MKKIILAAILVLWAAVLLFAQPKPKSNKAEAAPTAKEMEALMRQAQEEIDKLDPETKRMMDSMGVKMPSFNEIPQVTDKQLADAYAEEGRVIPSKKTQLIATLPKKILTNTELTAFVKATNAAVVRTITPKSKALGDKVILQFQADKHYGAMIASAANGMWIMGLKEPAVYLMGKATEALPNADNFNNYAAYLTMSGAAHAAIPLLEKLNRTHKKNSTVLNNLGQAWLQLGDGDRANKYLDSAIRVYAYHPQANYTKCLILESEGKIAEAAVALNRSLKHSVTKNKMDKLRQLEKKQSGQKKYYVPRTYFSTSFNLGLYTAVLPTRYTTGVGGADIEAEWKFAREKQSKPSGWPINRRQMN
jgi:Flp pilus assembly protein TadD